MGLLPALEHAPQLPGPAAPGQAHRHDGDEGRAQREEKERDEQEVTALVFASDRERHVVDEDHEAGCSRVIRDREAAQVDLAARKSRHLRPFEGSHRLDLTHGEDQRSYPAA